MSRSWRHCLWDVSASHPLLMQSGFKLDYLPSFMRCTICKRLQSCSILTLYGCMFEEGPESASSRCKESSSLMVK